MAEVKKIATRESYGKALKEFGSDERIVVLDADLSKSTKTDTFKKEFPERFINMGIAEQNMMSTAAGLASCGKVVFASSFAMFAAGRAFEQIRNSICYPNLNVKIGATHAGISVGEDGATHQCLEDIGIMRTIPNMVVINPADDVEAVMTAEELADCINDVKNVTFAESLCTYVAQLAAATRVHPAVELGASPRASLALMNASRAYAYINGRDYVVPEDIAKLIVPVVSHRISLRQEMRMKKQTVNSVLQDVLMSVPAPVRGR